MSVAEAGASGWRGSNEEGGKLKEADTTHWYSPNEGATNESGFSALPGGYRGVTGNFFQMGSYAYFWSSSLSSIGGPWTRSLNYNSVQVGRNRRSFGEGFSIRCIRD
jgi:uncharacterized protein (TIGR02145 family)